MDARFRHAAVAARASARNARTGRSQAEIGHELDIRFAPLTGSLTLGSLPPQAVR